MRRILVLIAVLVLAGGSSSCRLFRRNQPAASAPAPATPRPKLEMPEPKEIPQTPPPEPPEIAAGEADLQAPPALIVIAQPEEPLPEPKRRPTRTKTRAEERAEPEAVVAVVPQLQQILSPEQEHEYTQDIDRHLGKARHTLEVLSGRRLNGEQATYLDRIRAFIEQAQEARKSDLVRAKTLAERASVLAEDLLKTAP